MSKNWYFCGQFIVAAVFSVIFFRFFGLSTITKFVRKDIQTVVNSSPNTEGLVPPAITVCAMGDGDTGWKSNTADYLMDLQTLCNSGDNFNKLKACVRNDTFSLNETVNYVQILTNHGKLNNTLNMSTWTSSMGLFLLGLCHTLVYTEPVDRHSWILINLVKKYEVILHDPTFYLQKSDNLFIPYVSLEKTGGFSYNIITSQLTRMNRPGKFECNSNADYNFNTCIHHSLAAMVGCQFPWDGKGALDSMQRCNTTTAVQEYEKINQKLYMSSKEEVAELTGCQVPCWYQDYSIVGAPTQYPYDGEAYITLRYASTDIAVNEEVLIFPFDSLVSEFGGALGLFLGFSFTGALGSFASLAKAILAKGIADTVTDQANTNIV
jgi:hypothetical protein